MMQVNIINEKIYFFLWFWFVALAIITGVQQVWILSHRLKSGAIDTVLRLVTYCFDKLPRCAQMYPSQM